MKIDGTGIEAIAIHRRNLPVQQDMNSVDISIVSGQLRWKRQHNSHPLKMGRGNVLDEF
jgi:hypothetical protein